MQTEAPFKESHEVLSIYCSDVSFTGVLIYAKESFFDHSFDGDIRHAVGHCALDGAR
jgi:hypothetical protein